MSHRSFLKSISIAFLLITAGFIFAEEKSIEIIEVPEDESILPEVEIVETAPPATTSLSGKEAVEHNEFTLDESLQRAAGIYVEKAPKGHSRLKMRGYEMDMIGFFIDGIPINDIYNTNIDIAQIPVFSYSNINIQRGAASALYGCDASVGLIELKSGIPDTGRFQSGLSYDFSGSDLLNNSYDDSELFNSGITAYALIEDMLDDFYYKAGASYYDNGGYSPSASLTTETKKVWLETILSPELYGDSLSSFLISNASMLDYAAYDNSWRNTFSTGLNLTGKAGLFIGDNAEAGISAAFNYNRKNSVSYLCEYLSTWDFENEAWITGADPAGDGFTERDWEWPYMYDWYVTPYYEQQLDSLLIKTNIYLRILTNSLIWSGSYSNWFETTCGGRISAEWDMADWNTLSAALIIRNDDHTESESFYTSLPPTPLQKYLGGLRPSDEEVPHTIIVKELAGAQGAIALEDKISLSIVEITAGCSYDVQFFYKNNGETGYWRQNQDDSWYYELKTNDISSSDALIFGSRDSFNPVLNIDLNIVPDIFTINFGSSVKTRFPSFDNYYTDFVVMGDELFREELKNQISWNLNLGAEYIILHENLSLRCDIFYTSYTNKLEDYINKEAETVYFNIPQSDSYGLEALCFFNAEVPELLLILGSLGYTFNVGSIPGQAESVFTYNPAHEILFDIKAETITEHPTKLMLWGKYSTGAVTYRMKSIPPSTGAYPGEYLEAVSLHSPFFLNCRISQHLPADFSLFFLVENILDDYGIDPFNPGAGRTFSVGVDFDVEDFQIQ
ncbi:MAG: TonB-dependent receptor plug domain-containing protein [Spirochaetales bacterium]|nr:TonB-dependent receptor plug domain-containing protein [Spirochaetales bacterium]